MNDQAMNIEFNLESEKYKNEQIGELVIAIDKLEIRKVFLDKFYTLLHSELFTEIIIDTLLGSEADTLAQELLVPWVTEEVEQNTLLELRSLRYFKQSIAKMEHEQINIGHTIDRNKKLLLDIQAGKEEYL